MTGPSIVDRFFPDVTGGLLGAPDLATLRRQEILRLGASLLSLGGRQASQPGTLANIGTALGGMDLQGMAQNALRMKAYQQATTAEQQQRATLQAIAAKYANIADPRERMVRIMGELALMPGMADMVGQLGKGLEATKVAPRREPIRIEHYRDNKLGSPTHGLEGTVLLDPDTQERIGFIPQVQTEKEPTPVERVAGSQLDSATASVAALEDIAQRNPAAAKAAVTAIRAGGWGKLGTIFSEARGYATDPDAQNFYTEFNNALLSFSPIYGGTRTTQQILQLEKAAVLPALGSGDFSSAFAHLHNRLHDLRAKAGKAAGPAPRTPSGPPPKPGQAPNPFGPGGQFYVAP